MKEPKPEDDEKESWVEKVPLAVWILLLGPFVVLIFFFHRYSGGEPRANVHDWDQCGDDPRD